MAGLIQFKDDMLTASTSIHSIKGYMKNVGSDVKNFSDYLTLLIMIPHQLQMD